VADVRQLAQFGEAHSRSSRAADEDPTVVDVKVLDGRLDCIRGDGKQFRPQLDARRRHGVAVVATIGDGSFQYSNQAIWTAAQHKLPIVFVVLRSGEYAILKSFAEP
jgi:hypothetical protein